MAGIMKSFMSKLHDQSLTPGPSPVATGEGWRGSDGVRASYYLLELFRSSALRHNNQQ